MSEHSDPRAAAQDPRPDVHRLLLELAGRLDDDLLAWARELVAVGEEGQAVELAVAALVAERVVLPPQLRAAVVQAGHTDLDAEAELAPAAPGDAPGHRFDADAGSGDRVAAVLAALPARRLAGCTLHLTWRLTPAGTAPGPVPRAVVLVETGPDRSADVLAYLLTTELERAGVPASVEVFTAGADLPAYHSAALRSARRIEVGASVIAPAGVVVARTAAEAAARAEPAAEDGRADTAALFVVASDAGEARRAGRRRRREPEAAVPEAAVPEAATPEPAAPRPDDAPDTDPFAGPLRVPLLAPLLDPTTARSDDTVPPAVPTPIRPVPAQPAAGAPPVEPEVPEVDPPVAPGVPDEVPQEWEDEWRSGEWAMPPGRPSVDPPSAEGFDVFETPAAPGDANAAEANAAQGNAAQTNAAEANAAEANATEQTGRTELPTRQARPAAEPAPPVELPTRARRGDRPAPAGGDPGAVPRSAPADVSLFDSPTARVNPSPRPGAGEVPLFGEPPRRPEGPPPDPVGRRRRPEPDPDPDPAGDAEPSMLSSTERDLLAQLQAELADRERRPRPYRRARTSVSPAVNGHGVNGHGVGGSDGRADGNGPDDPAGG